MIRVTRVFSSQISGAHGVSSESGMAERKIKVRTATTFGSLSGGVLVKSSCCTVQQERPPCRQAQGERAKVTRMIQASKRPASGSASVAACSRAKYSSQSSVEPPNRPAVSDEVANARTNSM